MSFLTQEKGLAVLLISVLFFCGCVNVPVVPEHMPELGTAMNGDGDLTITLTTQVGYVYTILYEDPETRKMKPLKGAELIKGTGEVIEIKKKVNPRRPVPDLIVEHSKIVQ